MYRISRLFFPSLSYFPLILSVQFFDRIKLFGMPAKHQPDLIYLRYVPLWKVHIFTLLQLTCLVLLWVIKVSAAAVVFPMMVTTSLVFKRVDMDMIQDLTYTSFPPSITLNYEYK